MKKLMLFFALLISVTVASGQTAGGGEYVYQQAYNSNGDPISFDMAPKQLLVTVVSIYGITKCQCAQYDSILGMYSGNMEYEFAGSNNGWNIFRAGGGIMGIDWLYVYRDFSKVRLSLSFFNGNYVQYRLKKEGEDINTNPTR